MQTLTQLHAGQLKGATKIKISCGLCDFPEELFSLAETLEILDLSGNNLTSLPNDFHRFHHLKILFLSDNKFTIFPEVLGKCKQLDIIGFKANQIEVFSESSLPANTRWLILTNNRLKELPESIGKCTRMQKLMLAGNQLQKLPIELKECKNLGLIRISANKVTHLPEWLLQMPKLSWIAFAGNPFCIDNCKAGMVLDIIDWNDLTLVEKLGEGASGIIWKALWKKEVNDHKSIAVKIFKGTVTSDGMPDDELNACMLAGDHPNLVRVLGKLYNHPEKKEGLLLSLIPPHYTNLGNPPSFESCTRDLYDDGVSFSLKDILAIVDGIASVAAHLHEKGIMHGDLYAHNTLIGTDAHPLFGDFGAASIYNRKDAKAYLLERIEVSAFGCLLEDLLNHTKEANRQNTVDTLWQLKEECMQETVANRPSFREISEHLSTLRLILPLTN